MFAISYSYLQQTLIYAYTAMHTHTHTTRFQETP